MHRAEQERLKTVGHLENSFAIMPDLRRRMPRPGSRKLWAWRILYNLRARWRSLRIRRWMTAVLGPQYRRSRDLIEIDITYQCNLHCLNCNRSVTQAPEARHMPVDAVSRFVDESLSSGRHWRRVRILGGEPTLHPQFQEIVGELLRYRRVHPSTIVEVVTNGHGKRVEGALAALPAGVMVDNSRKEHPTQPHFGPFNLAPIDDPAFENAVFSNGCAILEECGLGLTPMGYYPCAVAGGIDRILGEDRGMPTLPNDGDDMLTEVHRFCRLCGRYRDGHFVPRVLRPPLLDARMSPTWKALYAAWSARPRP
jgi:Radical SAM superfamily